MGPGGRLACNYGGGSRVPRPATNKAPLGPSLCCPLAVSKPHRSHPQVTSWLMTDWQGQEDLMNHMSQWDTSAGKPQVPRIPKSRPLKQKQLAQCKKRPPAFSHCLCAQWLLQSATPREASVASRAQGQLHPELYAGKGSTGRVRERLVCLSPLQAFRGEAGSLGSPAPSPRETPPSQAPDICPVCVCFLSPPGALPCPPPPSSLQSHRRLYGNGGPDRRSSNHPSLLSFRAFFLGSTTGKESGFTTTPDSHLSRS